MHKRTTENSVVECELKVDAGIEKWIKTWVIYIRNIVKEIVWLPKIQSRPKISKTILELMPA